MTESTVTFNPESMVRTGSPPEPMSPTRGVAPLVEETFSYCVGRPWPVEPNNPEGTTISVYAYGSQVHHGTLSDAEEFRKYVVEKTGQEEFIYKLVKVA